MAKEFGRNQRMGEVLQRELAVIIQQEAKDPRLDMITISDVEVSSDLSYAKVYVTIFNAKNEERIAENIKVLNKMAGFLRSLLGKRIKARTVPQLKFIYDATIIEGNRLAKIIDDSVADLPPEAEPESDSDANPDDKQ